MKLAHIACIAALAATPVAHAQHGGMKGMDHSQGAAHGTVAQAHRADALKNLKPGARVEFEFEQRGKDYVITRIH